MKENNSNIDVKEKNRMNIKNIIVIVAIVIFAVISFVNNRANYLKIKEIGEQYVSIFTSDFYRQITMFIIAFLITYLIFYINNRFIRKGLKKFADENGTNLPKLPNKSASLIAALISGTLVNKFLYQSFRCFL